MDIPKFIECATSATTADEIDELCQHWLYQAADEQAPKVRDMMIQALGNLQGTSMMALIKPTMEAVFEEWFRRYTEDPTQFHKLYDAEGKPIEGYGKQCAAFYKDIEKDLSLGV